MTLLHRLRRAALRVGLDVRRAETTGPARLTRLLDRIGADLVLDVGANDGQFGQSLRRCGYKGAICSFEPMPQAFAELERRTEGDSSWTARAFALGDREGEVDLNIAGNEGGASSSLLRMLPRHERGAPESRYVDTVVVRMRALDEVWEDVVSPGRTVFLKLDVQGFERQVLDGAASHVRELAGVQQEISLVPLYEGAMTPRDVFERMDEIGMRLVQIEPGFSDPATGDLLQVDGVFVRGGQA